MDGDGGARKAPPEPARTVGGTGARVAPGDATGGPPMVPNPDPWEHTDPWSASLLPAALSALARRRARQTRTSEGTHGPGGLDSAANNADARTAGQRHPDTAERGPASPASDLPREECHSVPSGPCDHWQFDPEHRDGIESGGPLRRADSEGPYAEGERRMAT